MIKIHGFKAMSDTPSQIHFLSRDIPALYVNTLCVCRDTWYKQATSRVSTVHAWVKETLEPAQLPHSFQHTQRRRLTWLLEKSASKIKKCKRNVKKSTPINISLCRFVWGLWYPSVIIEIVPNFAAFIAPNSAPLASLCAKLWAKDATRDIELKGNAIWLLFWCSDF